MGYIWRKEGRKWREGGEMKHSMGCTLICPFTSPHLAQVSHVGHQCWPYLLQNNITPVPPGPTSSQGCPDHFSASDPCNCLNLVTEQQQESWKSLRQGSGVWGWHTAESWSLEIHSLGGAIRILPWTSCSPSDLSSLLHGLSGPRSPCIW